MEFFLISPLTEDPPHPQVSGLGLVGFSIECESNMLRTWVPDQKIKKASCQPSQHAKWSPHCSQLPGVSQLCLPLAGMEKRGQGYRLLTPVFGGLLQMGLILAGPPMPGRRQI